MLERPFEKERQTWSFYVKQLCFFARKGTNWQFVIEEMSSGLLEDYFQMKAEWEAGEAKEGVRELRHRWSREVAELLLLAGTPMRQLDLLSSRQVYSFPLCPRVYKCSIVGNYCAGNELRVDIAVLLEKLTGNFSDLSFHPQRRELIKKLEKQLEQLVCGLEYLWRRYGPFLVSDRMISWNAYGWVRVWLNQSPLVNQVERTAESEEDMVKSIVRVLEECLQLRFTDRNITTFRALMACIQDNQYSRCWEGSKRVKFLAESRASQLSSSQNALLQSNQTKSIALNSKGSIDSKAHSLKSGKESSCSNFQFDSRGKRTRGRKQLSSERPVHDGERSLIENAHGQNSVSKMEPQHQFPANDHNAYQPLGDADVEEKENTVGVRRKVSKTLTCMLASSQAPLRHSRRYSNTLIDEQATADPMYHTQECLGKRKSSLLRLQLQSDFDGLFRSSGEVSFDESELQKELEGVL